MLNFPDNSYTADTVRAYERGDYLENIPGLSRIADSQLFVDGVVVCHWVAIYAAGYFMGTL